MRTRPVRPDDEPFLFQVYASTRQEEVAAWGWDATQQEAFLRMQFQAQSRSYEWQFPSADRRIILQGEEPIGYSVVNRTAAEVRLVDIALRPEGRGAGTGTALIRQLQAEAAGAAKPLRLTVHKGNRAHRLYERLGFVVTEESALYDAMEWVSPGSQ